MSIFQQQQCLLGSTYRACKLYNCLAGTSKAVIHTDTDVFTEDIEQQPRALSEEYYLSPIQEIAVVVTGDVQNGERDLQEHWQVLFDADCRLLSFLLLLWVDCVYADLAKFSLQLLYLFLSVHLADVATFHKLLHHWASGWPQHLLS